MRILHVIPHYFPATRYGGPIRSVHGLAVATAKLGHEVHVYTTNIDGAIVSDVPTCEPVNIDGVKVRYFPVGLGRKIFRSPYMGRALDANIASFDIVHIHYVWVWTTVCAAMAARRHGVPYVLAPRGMLVADLIRRRSAIAKNLWLALFDARNVAAAAAIHTTSLIEARDLKDLGLTTQRVAVIANGVELPTDPAVSINPQLQFGREGIRRPFILFLGRISWKKGLDRLIRALPAVETVDLIIAGYDEEGYATVVELLAKEVLVSSRVHLIGPVEGLDKWALIRAASCLILPSYNENFGMVVVEAMAVGCPVVVTGEVGLADVVAETGSGVVAPGDPAGLAAAINSVFGDPVKARAMGEAGRQTVAVRFGWSAIASQIVELYADCIKSALDDPTKR